MIAVLYLWQRIDAYGAKYQSGTDVVAYFNTALAEVQAEVFNDFAPLYQANEKVKTLLDIWVKEQSASSDSSGLVTVGADPEVIYRPISVGYGSSGSTTFSIPQIDETELIAISRIPQRTPNVSNKNVYYRFNAPNIMQLYPKTTIPYDMFYMVHPTLAEIAFTYTTTADEDVMTYDPGNSTDLLWPQSAQNLILYKLLEKYSINVRELLLQEYSKYGFTQTATAGEGVKA